MNPADIPQAAGLLEGLIAILQNPDAYKQKLEEANVLAASFGEERKRAEALRAEAALDRTAAEEALKQVAALRDGIAERVKKADHDLTLANDRMKRCDDREGQIQAAERVIRLKADELRALEISLDSRQQAQDARHAHQEQREAELRAREAEVNAKLAQLKSIVG